MLNQRNQPQRGNRSACRDRLRSALRTDRPQLASGCRPVNGAERLSPAVTVCISTHDGAHHLAGLFSALTRQTLGLHQWEVLVLDLASTDDSSEVAQRCLLGKFGGRGRVVRVEQPGLAWTRARAAREASGEIICFMEDHHRPAPDFLAAVVQAFAEHPAAGVIGGKVLPLWQTQPSPLAELTAPFALGLGDLGETSQCLASTHSGVPGAGLCIRRDIMRGLASAPAPELTLIDVEFNGVINNVDLGISVAARQWGWQCWYVPTLTIHHVLETGCLDKARLLRLYQQMGRRQSALRPPAGWRALADFFRWQFLRWRGPSAALRQQHPALAADLHDLQLQPLRGRLRQAKTGKI